LSLQEFPPEKQHSKRRPRLQWALQASQFNSILDGEHISLNEMGLNGCSEGVWVAGTGTASSSDISEDGCNVGAKEGSEDGGSEGVLVAGTGTASSSDIPEDGCSDGVEDGGSDGVDDGCSEGANEGWNDGCREGMLVAVTGTTSASDIGLDDGCSDTRTTSASERGVDGGGSADVSVKGTGTKAVNSKSTIEQGENSSHQDFSIE